MAQTKVILFIFLLCAQGFAARIEAHVTSDNYVFGNSSTFNWGGATTLKVDEGTLAADYRTVASWGKASFSSTLSDAQLAVIVVDVCTLYIPVTTVTTSGDVAIHAMWRPIKAGNNDGTAADADEMNWTNWSENGADDSTWKTGGIEGASDTDAWNRTSGSTNNDRKSTADATITISGTGYNPVAVDAAYVQAALRAMATDANRQINYRLVATSAPGANLVLSALEGGGEAEFFSRLVVVYTIPATTKGNMRHGADNNGVWRNDR